MKKHPRSKPSPSFHKILEDFPQRLQRDPRQLFRAFCRLSACALSAGAREEEYLTEIQEQHWTAEDLSRFGEALAALVAEMEAAPFQDLLGPVHMEMGGNRKAGEFYTPDEVARFMAQALFLEPIPAAKIVTLADPACGSGGLILAAAQSCGRPGNLRVTAIDVSPLACDMCFINTSLWFIPAEIIHGNSLSLFLYSDEV